MGQLYAALGVTELDEPALLERFVLPRFPSLPAPQQAAARAQVRRHWHTLQTRPKVVDILKTTPLVSVHGSLLRADQLLDPANSLTMLRLGHELRASAVARVLNRPQRRRSRPCGHGRCDRP